MRSPRPGVVLLALAVVAGGCSYTVRELDVDLPRNAESSIVYASDGTVIHTLHAEENRTELSLAEIPDTVQHAVIAIEDERFYLHNGVDLRAVFRAVRVNTSEGSVSQGGSTITQQLVKTLFLRPDQTLERKIQEITLAWQLERTYTKGRILELYLNTIYFGNGAYGVQAAAREYFGKAAGEVTVAEAALLAGLIQTPGATDPHDEPEAAIARRDMVLAAMLDQEYIDQAVHDAAVLEALTLAPDVPITEERYLAGHFVEEVKQWILDDPLFGATPLERRDMLFGGGLRIHTTVDLAAQAAAEAAIAEILPDPNGPDASLVAVEPSTGFVRAMVGGRDFFGAGEQAKFNLALGNGRHTGSAFKPFVLTAALQEGIPLSTQFSAPGSITLTYGTPPQVWPVDNYGEGGPGVPVNLVEATVHSYNTVYAQLILDVGTDRAIDIAESMGITTGLDRFPSAVLGANDVQPLEMASAYGTLANRGVHVAPALVTLITRTDGTIVYEHEHAQKRVIDAEVADQVTGVLEQVIDRGTGTAADIGRPAAGKTGTAQGWRNAWFCGYTPQLAAAVWVGFPGAVQLSMTPPRTSIRVTGGSYPARIWQRFMAAVTASMPVVDFVAPIATTSLPGAAPTIAPGTPQQLPNVVGLNREQAEHVLRALGFVPSSTQVPTNASAAGTVVGQSPPGGTTVPTGSVVTLQVAVAPGGGGGGPTTTATGATAIVPNVLGDRQRNAVDELEGAGFRVVIVETINPNGHTGHDRVWQQEPAGGSIAPYGSTVRITVEP